MMNETPYLSILIVTFNRKDDVRRCLDSLWREMDGMPAEVLAIDNASNDGTPDMITMDYPWVHLTRWGENHGMGPALRALTDHARGEWLLILDSDAVLHPGCLKALLEFARNNPRVGAVAPTMRDPNGGIQMTARNFPTPLNAILGRQTALSRLWPNNPITRGYLRSSDREHNLPFQCDWVAFATVLIRRSALESCGSVDSKFFVYWIDADFFKRLKKAGWEVWCLPEAEALHLEYNRPNRVRSPRSIRDFHRGAFRYFYKNHGWGGLNPLLLPAALGLWTRTQLHLIINWMRMKRSRTA